MAQQVQQQAEQPIQIQHGHTDTHVIVVFTRPIDNLRMTPAQAEAMIKSIGNSLEMLKAHLASGKKLHAGAANES